MRVKLLGYAPDLDPTTPGIMVECTAFVSSHRGMTGAPAPVDTPLAALASACVGIATFRKLDNTSLTFAGTATKLYLAGTTTWTDLSGAATFNASTTNRWSFAQFGDVTLASNKGDTIQARTSGDFADVSGSAPQAAFIETVNQFVFAANVNDGVDKPDGWACSALGDYTDWTASIATQAANGRLTDTPGPFTGLKRLHDNIVLYKRNAIYVGTYVGPDVIWSFQLSSAEVGAVSNSSVAAVEYAHYFMGPDDFYIFDGTRPIPFGATVKETVYADLDKSALHLCTTLVDRKNTRLYFFYPSEGNGGYANKCVVYNYRTKRWGRDDRSVEATGDYVTAGTTYADVGTYYSTYGSLPSAAYGLAFLSAATETPAIVNSSHKLQTLTGTPTITGFKTGEFGSNETYTVLARIQPRFLREPDTGTFTGYYKYTSGDTAVEDDPVSMQDCRFDHFRSARWHAGRFSFTGSVDVVDLDVTATVEGAE